MLEKICSFEQYQTKLKDYRKRHRIKYFNNFLMKNDIQNLIDEKKLYYVKHDKSFSVLEKNNNSYILHFFTESVLPSFYDIQVEIRFNYVSKQNIDDNFIKEIENSGFKLLSRNLEMKRSKKETQIDRFENYIFREVETEEISALRFIWTSSLNTDVNPIPDMKKYKDSIYVLEYKNELVGGVQIVKQGRFLMIEHFAIAKAHRKMGLGQIMLEKLFYYYNHEDWMLWVQEENINAINFYKKNGFTFSQKVSYQFVSDAND